VRRLLHCTQIEHAQCDDRLLLHLNHTTTVTIACSYLCLATLGVNTLCVTSGKGILSMRFVES